MVRIMLKNKIVKTKENISSKSDFTKLDLSFKTLFNLPNSLTILRIILAPFFMWAMLVSDYIAAVIIIFIASITDFLDGFLARKLNMQTQIGAIIDPLADKVLIFCSIIALLIKFHFPLWIGIVIMSRDIILLIGGLIFFMNHKSQSLRPNIFGKVSTFFQMTTIIIYIIASLVNYYSFWIDLLLYLTVVATLISGITYISRIGQILAKNDAKGKQ